MDRCTLPAPLVLVTLTLASLAHADDAPAPDSAPAPLELADTSDHLFNSQASDGRYPLETPTRNILVEPTSLPDIPFLFPAISSQVSFRTHGDLAWTPGSSNVSQPPATAKTVFVAQEFGLSLRFGRFEPNLAVIGHAAGGIDGDSIVRTGAAIEAGFRLGAGVEIYRADSWTVVVRTSGQYLVGDRINPEPLLNVVVHDPTPLLGGHDPSDLLFVPTREFRFGLGLAAAYAPTSTWSLQMSLAGEWIPTRSQPWLASEGTTASGQRDERFDGWLGAAGVALGRHFGKAVFQAQVSGSLRHDVPRDTSIVGPLEWNARQLAIGLGGYYAELRDVQIGALVGFEFGRVQGTDSFGNDVTAYPRSVFLQAVGRFVWK
jgi:hypothetical protein